MNGEGNTTNPTKSPCDPYVFNTVLTRSKSLVVVVGSPVALLKIEEHMVRLYGMKAKCWSNFLKSCLENGTFFIPPIVESLESKVHDFQLQLKEKLYFAEMCRRPISFIQQNKFEMLSLKLSKTDTHEQNKIVRKSDSDGGADKAKQRPARRLSKGKIYF